MEYKLINKDCIEAMKELESNSIDSIITDPPYELGFMGKEWDRTGVAFKVEVWRECLRVLKPGGHLISFGGSRTYHRMACAIEDAGFEIRDQIIWMYGSGFPKSLNIAQSIEKQIRRINIDNSEKLELFWKDINLSNSELAKICNVSPALVLMWKKGERRMQEREFNLLKDYLKLNKDCEKIEIFNFLPDNRELDFIKENSMVGWNTDKEKQDFKDLEVKKIEDDNAKKWSGWGTALKPSHEPMVLARKPLTEKTVSQNVLKWGVGGINVDECRVLYSETNKHIPQILQNKREVNSKKTMFDGQSLLKSKTKAIVGGSIEGRFPANLIHDGSEEIESVFPQTGSGNNEKPYNYSNKKEYENSKENSLFNLGDKPNSPSNYNDFGSASRYFYCAKTSKKDREEGLEKIGDKRANNHPTVKPTELMQYLIKLITPNGGTILDPFNGSGSTGKAAALLNRDYKYIGIELVEEYVKISKVRIEWAIKNKKRCYNIK